MPLTATLYFPILVIDTASSRTHVGLGSAAGSWSWYASSEESGTALFRGVDSCLNESQLALGSIRTVVFCEGPGSMLGIRTAAMAIRTWATTRVLSDTPVLAYSSLALALTGVLSETDSGPVAIVIDARRKSWYCLNSDRSSKATRDLRRVPVDEMSTMAPVVFLPEGFPVWSQRLEHWKDCPYEPKWLEKPEIRNAILRPVDLPDAFIIDPPVYRRWTPAISRPVSQKNPRKGVKR